MTASMCPSHRMPAGLEQRRKDSLLLDTCGEPDSFPASLLQAKAYCQVDCLSVLLVRRYPHIDARSKVSAVGVRIWQQHTPTSDQPAAFNVTVTALPDSHSAVAPYQTSE